MWKSLQSQKIKGFQARPDGVILLDEMFTNVDIMHKGTGRQMQLSTAINMFSTEFIHIHVNKVDRISSYINIIKRYVD